MEEVLTSQRKSNRESAEVDSEEEQEILEESPSGRWLKRKERVEQRDVPGIDAAHLAMDSEEGKEVVWNEVRFSERRIFKSQEEKIKNVFNKLTSLKHPNIVQFHAYWADTKSDPLKLVFITEYMAGSIKSFIQKTKINNSHIQLKVWKRWCTQILSALSYLHSCDSPIIHGNLRLNTIFIQQNGLIKIGSVAPDAIHQNVKTFRDHHNSNPFLPPEYSRFEPLTTAVDIYSFGICALEMTGFLEYNFSKDVTNSIFHKAIENALIKINDPRQKDFLTICLAENPDDRPLAKELLFHPFLFEVHSLRLIASHSLIKNMKILPQQLIEFVNNYQKSEEVFCEMLHLKGAANTEIKYSQLANLQLEEVLDDLQNGFYPLIALTNPNDKLSNQCSNDSHNKTRPISPCEDAVPTSVKPLDICETYEYEKNRVTQITCFVQPINYDSQLFLLNVILKMSNKINRQLQCEINLNTDTAILLSSELSLYRFINQLDEEKICVALDEFLNKNIPNGIYTYPCSFSANQLNSYLINGLQNSATSSNHQSLIMLEENN